jgi:hypothetical protein
VHRELVRKEPRYRAVVTRETDEETAADALGKGGAAPREDTVPKDRRTALSDVLDELEEIEETA